MLTKELGNVDESSGASWRDYYALTKPGVVQLLVFTLFRVGSTGSTEHRIRLRFDSDGAVEKARHRTSVDSRRLANH